MIHKTNRSTVNNPLAYCMPGVRIVSVLLILCDMANTGQIIKSRSTGNFTIVPNEPFRRDDLSLQAKGLLIYLLSLPANWVIYKRELPNHFTNGKDAVINAFSELEDKGYVLSVEMRNKEGQFKGFNHIVYDVSQIDKAIDPIPENPDVG